MTKELQDLAWSVLPKEFKEEVKKEYAKYVAIDVDDNPNLPAYAVESATSRRALLEMLFGEHNLTSDVEGEDEMLCVSRNEVRAIYNKIDSVWLRQGLEHLFGSKCLPDETAYEDNFASKEPKFHVGQRMLIKYLNKIGTIDIVQGYDEKEDGIYYHLKVEPKGEATVREENLQPYEEPKPTEPKFKKGNVVRYRYDGKLYIVEGKTGKYHYALRQHDGDIMMYDVLGSDLEPYTEPKEESSK